MKKYLFLVSVAAVALTACTNESEEYVGSNQAREISFSPIAQKHTRAAVESTTFPTQDMYVTAYNVTKSENFFGATTFSKSGTTWAGGKYWPLSPATINFLAYTGFTAGTATWDATNPASSVTLAMGDNKTAQNDLMYACGTGSVTQTGNSLTFPENVPMAFKHAQALFKFTVVANNTTAASSITVNSITLNDVSCQGTFTVTHTNWNQTSSQSVSGAWTAYNTSTGNVAAIKASGYESLSVSAQDFASLMVVPDQGITGFTINYTLDSKTYNYTYDLRSGTPLAPMSLSQATKYTYNISFGLNEILIAPSVTDWTSPSGIDVNI